MSYSAHLVSLNFVHQVAECWQAAEADHGLALLAAQPFHLGQGHPRQDDLFTSQEVLELGVVRQLAGGESEISAVTTSDLSENQPAMETPSATSCGGGFVPGHALEANLCQKHGKSDVIQVQHPSGCSVEHHLRKETIS